MRLRYCCFLILIFSFIKAEGRIGAGISTSFNQILSYKRDAFRLYPPIAKPIYFLPIIICAADLNNFTLNGSIGLYKTNFIYHYEYSSFFEYFYFQNSHLSFSFGVDYKAVKKEKSNVFFGIENIIEYSYNATLKNDYMITVAKKNRLSFNQYLIGLRFGYEQMLKSSLSLKFLVHYSSYPVTRKSIVNESFYYNSLGLSVALVKLF